MMPAAENLFQNRGRRLSSYQRMVIYETTQMGFSHKAVGKIYGVKSVPRIVKQVKSKLARLTPEQRVDCLQANNVGSA